MERVELCDEKLAVSVVHARSSVAGRCRRHRDETRHEYDVNQSHSHRRWRDSQTTLPREGTNQRWQVIRGNTDMNGALAWRAVITRYAPKTAPRVQSLN